MARKSKAEAATPVDKTPDPVEGAPESDTAPAQDEAPDDEDEGDETVDAIVQRARFNPDKLIGEVGDFLLSDLRASRELKPWAQLPEADQRALIDRAHSQAREIVRRVIQAVAAKGFSKIDAMLEGGSWKEGEITAKIKARLTPENLDALASGSPFVQVVFASLEAFEAPMQAKAEPNQRRLPIEEGIDPETGEVIERPRADGARTADFPGPDDEDDGEERDDEPVFDQTPAGQAAGPAR
jgi:hypothetical protein